MPIRGSVETLRRFGIRSEKPVFGFVGERHNARRAKASETANGCAGGAKL
jgi:hypothetical protein